MNIQDLFPTGSDVSKDLLRKALFGPVVNVQGFGAVGDGRNDDREAFLLAASHATGSTFLIPPGAYRIGKDLHLGADTNLYFLPGGMLVPDANVSVTIDGGLSAGPFQVFDVRADNATIGGNMAGTVMLPQWFGARTDDLTAAAANVRAFAALWAAIRPLNGLIFIPPGTYYVDDTVRFTDIVRGRAKNYYGTQLVGSGTIAALNSANFAGKAVVHVAGVELAALKLYVDAPRLQSVTSPAVGLALTRDQNHKGGGITGSIDISGAYTHAAYYNVSCENCHIQNSSIRNHGSGCVLWDAAENMDGLTIAPPFSDSNTRKSFSGCNFLSYPGTPAPVTLVRMGWISELSFRHCHFYMDNGCVFSDEQQGHQVHNLLIEECRCEVNLGRDDETTSRNRFLRIMHSLDNAQLRFVYFASRASTLMEVDGGVVGPLRIEGNSVLNRGADTREILVTNGGRVDELSGAARAAIEIRNGRGRSRIGWSDFSSFVDPAVVGDGIGRFTLRGGAPRISVKWSPGGALGLAPGADAASPEISLYGATFGDAVRVGAPYDVRGASLSGYVVAPGLIRIRVINDTDKRLMFPEGTWTIAVEKVRLGN